MDEIEKAALADRLEALLIQSGSLSQAQADYDRMLRMAAVLLLTNKAQRSVEHAVRTQNPEIVSRSLRELRQLEDEENFAISAVLAIA